MQNDDITWGILNRRNCSYKIKTETKHFCRNEFNVTGLCMRKACPLANSEYATVREHKGSIYLYIRLPENVYTPIKEWKRVKLAKNFIGALQQIEDSLVFWPKYYKTKCRQRFLKITQYLTRMRKIQLTSTKKFVPIRQKDERRLSRREEKALIAAKLDTEIEKQLLNRLKEGTYERIYNFPKQTFEKILETEEEEEMEEELEVLNEVNKIRVTVENEEEEEEEMETELRQELERGLVTVNREDDESDIDSDEFNDSDIEQANEQEEEVEDSGEVEYVADFEESEDEEGGQPELDIEDLSERLGLEAPPQDPTTRRRNGPFVAKKYTGNRMLDEKEVESYTNMKYNVNRNLTTNQKMKIKRRKAKQKLKSFAEKRDEHSSKRVTLKK